MEFVVVCLFSSSLLNLDFLIVLFSHALKLCMQVKPVAQNYWISGLCLLSGILNTKEHNVSEILSVSILR
jgi:hypothetical protein